MAAAIDQVIARARQADGGFSERKQFKLARRRAIEKLRRFALADPYFYILELIQAAVAGGADYVDIACSEGDVLVSWTGGSLREDELAALFDFLFASKERIDLAHIRSLALGVNALMLFEPEQVVIESGDGTPGNTTRMVVRAGAEAVDVGRADRALAGTYVRATKLDRAKVAETTGRRGDEDGGLEYATVELRCLAAPVPIVFNGQPLFGWSRQRVPNLFGYDRVQSLDEGDLYGTVGLKPVGGEPGFQLLTHGVWVQSYTYDLIPGQRLGGVVCFDRLHKTVDHSGFVRDERFEELWVRLRPYAEALVHNRAQPVASITGVDGLAYSPTELRTLLRERPRVVVLGIEGDEAPTNEISLRAKALARQLDAELLCVPDSQIAGVRVLGDRELLMWRPVFDSIADQRFYAQPQLAPPAPPHMLAPTELTLPTLDGLIEQIIGATNVQGTLDAPLWQRKLDELAAAKQLAPEAAGNGELLTRLRAQLRVMLGETGTMKATLYTPADPDEAARGEAAQGLLVRVTSTGRRLIQMMFMSAYPGRILDVELPTAQASALRQHGFARNVAERMAALAIPLMREQDDRTLAGLGVGKLEPGTPAARMALQVLSRVTITRLRTARPGPTASVSSVQARTTHESAGLSFSLVRSLSGFDPYALPLLRTVSGQPLSLRELALLTDATGGLVYATIPEVAADLDGLDRDRVLALDEHGERTLIGLLGESGYVRVDARDVLCEHEGVRVRDIAIGLRTYPEFPLLVEGAVEQLDTLDHTALLDALLRGLIDRMHGRADEPDGDPLALEEHRRQAVRHLQWYACRSLAAGRAVRGGVLDLPLFLDIDGEVWSLAQVHAALRSDEGLLVHYGHVLGSAELGALTQAAGAGRQAADGLPSSLAVSAFCHRLLAPLGRSRLAFDFDLDDIEAAQNPMTAAQAFLVRVNFESRWANGVLGIPATRLGARPGGLSAHAIQLRARGRGSIAALDELAHRYGLVGSLEIDDAAWDEHAPEALLAALDEQAVAMLDALIGKLASLGDDPQQFGAALQVLLGYLGDQLTLIASPVGLTAELGSALAQRVAGLPLFDTGAATPVSAHRMIERFRQHFEHRHTLGETIPAIDWSGTLSADAPDVVRAWLDAHLQPSRVVMPASAGSRVVTPQPSREGPASAGERGPEDQPARSHEHQPWPTGRAMPLDVLAWNLERWLDALRPDPREDHSPRPAVRGRPGRMRPTRVWIAEHPVSDEHDDALVEGGDMRVDLYGHHPLVQRMAASPTPSHFAWLLLASYAHLNNVTGLITNAHETRFQAVVADALMSGKLVLHEPSPDELFDPDL